MTVLSGSEIRDIVTDFYRKGEQMQRISGFVELDFCEWVKRKVLARSQYRNIDMWDLLFNEEYDALLLKEAETYCLDRGKRRKICTNDGIKMIINEFMSMYYKSDEFLEFCQEVRYEGSLSRTSYEFGRSLRDFCYSLKENSSIYFDLDCDFSYQYLSNLSPNILVCNLRECYRYSLDNNQRDNPFLQLMVEGKAIEIEFLEWMHEKNEKENSVEKLDLMPVEIFEEYVGQFCEDTGNGISAKRKLVKNFRRSDPKGLISKLKRLLPDNNEYRIRNFRYISKRYFDDKVTYKCVILPIQKDYGQFNELVKNHWKELNDTSADFLDIYYCFANYGESGHDLMKQLHYLPKKYYAKLPCILLWKDNMEDAKCISIHELSVDDVFYMIAEKGGIVDLIIEEKSIDEIVKEVNAMGEKRRNKNRPIYEYVQNANGASNIQQTIVVDSSNVTISGDFSAEHLDVFMDELDQAINLVISSKLNERQKKELQSIFEEARAGVQEKSDEKVLTSKRRFSTFLAFAGKTCQTLIASLAQLATIANYFGIKYMNTGQ